MSGLGAAVLAVRFLLEVAALAALGYWGFTVDRPLAGRWLLGLGVPLFAAVVWGLFVAPKAQVELAEPLKVALAVIILSASALALAVAGHPALAVVFAVLIALDKVLLVVLRV